MIDALSKANAELKLEAQTLGDDHEPEEATEKPRAGVGKAI